MGGRWGAGVRRKPSERAAIATSCLGSGTMPLEIRDNAAEEVSNLAGNIVLVAPPVATGALNVDKVAARD